MAIFNSFWDESGKFKDHKVISFSGVCASKLRLEHFEDEWNGLLRRNALPWLTMKEVCRLKKKISSAIPAQSIQERIEVLKPFALCIAKHFELGIAIAVDVEGYNEMSYEAKKRIGGSDDPFYLAFLRGISTAVQHVQPQDRITVICDDDEKTALNCFKFYRKVRIIHHISHQRLAAITFADDKSFPALQAADMLSTLVRLDSYRQFYHRFYDYKPLFDYLTEDRSANFIQWRVGFYDKAQLVQLSKVLEPVRLGT